MNSIFTFEIQFTHLFKMTENKLQYLLKQVSEMRMSLLKELTIE